MIADLLLSAALLQPAPVVKNPTQVEFVCPDHDTDTEHKLKIIKIDPSNQRPVVATILLGDPVYADAATKLVRAALNVQPIAFGDYVVRISVVVNGVESDESADSNLFTRAPGGPSKVVVK